MLKCDSIFTNMSVREPETYEYILTGRLAFDDGRTQVVEDAKGRIQIIDCDGNSFLIECWPSHDPLCDLAEEYFYLCSDFKHWKDVPVQVCLVKESTGERIVVSFIATILQKMLENPTAIVTSPDIFKGFLCEYFQGMWYLRRPFDPENLRSDHDFARIYVQTNLSPDLAKLPMCQAEFHLT